MVERKIPTTAMYVEEQLHNVKPKYNNAGFLSKQIGKAILEVFKYTIFYLVFLEVTRKIFYH